MDTLALIAASQQNDELAINKLLDVIKREHMPSHIRRFVQRNVLITRDEIESEFLLGCWEAVKQAKLDVGNPIYFICWKGKLSVIHLFRKRLREGVRVNCSTCGVGSLQYVAKKKTAVCARCGATDVSTFMVVTDETQSNPEFENADVETRLWDKIDPSRVNEINQAQFSNLTYEIQLDEIRRNLNGRVLQLFDILVIEGVNRETSDNYLDEIAKRWNVSTACVSVYLRKLRIKIHSIRSLDTASL